MFFTQKKNKIEVPLPNMGDDTITEFYAWCEQNNIKVKTIQKKGVVAFEVGFLTDEDMSKQGWDDNLSRHTKDFIEKVTPKKLGNYGKCAIVENEEDVMAIILRWT